VKLQVYRHDLPTRHPFTIARGTTTSQATLIVELEQAGFSGYGEAPEVRYYGATIGSTAAALERVKKQVGRFELSEPTVFWQCMRELLDDSPAALCALDCAAHDLWGKLHCAPVWQLWGLDPGRACPTDYTIGIDTVEVMVKKLQEFAGWPVYKIKLGTENDLAIVQALREHTDAVFRVDANCAWNARQTIENASALGQYGVELIEQPLPPDDWNGMEQVRADSPLPIIADESCRFEDDVERCASFFHGINIKLLKCGGLTPARRMIARARELGLKVMVGCFTESSVGISAAAQLLPLLDYADLDGALLLAEDTADGVRFEQGRPVYPSVGGCGLTLRAMGGAS
jgi:L-alanine-DL-glutamate epimerase-like enolase superfamily enzyme